MLTVSEIEKQNNPSVLTLKNDPKVNSVKKGISVIISGQFAKSITFYFVAEFKVSQKKKKKELSVDEHDN